MQYWYLLHSTVKFIFFMSHFQTLAKFGLSVEDDGEANSCSVSHILILFEYQEFIIFSQEIVRLVI